MIPRALTVAGSDSGGGAGIQADLKTFSAFKVFGMTAITALTSQNSLGVFGIQPVSPDFIRSQLEVILNDIGVDGMKTGMLSSVENVRIIADVLDRFIVPILIVDPVMLAKSGDRLIEQCAVGELIHRLISKAFLVTPNIPEAEILCGFRIGSVSEIHKAAETIRSFGAKAVLIKGGHRENDALDVLFDGNTFRHFDSPRIHTKNTHGTGCTYSAAILSNLLLGHSLEESVDISKRYITRAIRNAFALGKGHGPLNHFVGTT